MMSINCPFSTQMPQNIRIPSVPDDITSYIPFVPNPYSGVKFQMGVATPSYKSINNSKGFNSNKIYQYNSPHTQNSLTPCSVIGNKPSDTNSDNRRCYNIYSPGQNMIGEVCTTPGTDGSLYSRECTLNDSSGVNGNADWVRGNQFGVRYNSSMINNRTKYILNTPSIKENNKTYINYDKFYPSPSIDNVNNFMYKDYPHTNNYTENGYPTWKYPYSTTQLNSISPTEIISTNYINDIDIFDMIENFSSNNDSNINKRIYFWIGIVIIILSLIYCNKILK
jgi:hypothetical protein